MHRFDYGFLAKRIDGSLLNISNIIADLRGKDEIRRQYDPKAYDALRRMAVVNSVSSSNAIEGIVTTQNRMRDILLDDRPPVTHDEREILGYRNALNDIYSNASSLDITEDTILHLHKVMLESTSTEAGLYKKENNWIQEIDAGGRRSVRFVPVSAADTPAAVQQMLLAYYDARQNSSISRLLLAFCFIVDFLCIHPFLDGNGRISRLLTILVLEREGYTIGRYISIEQKIDEYKENYCDALKESSAGWMENSSSYTPFMIYMLQILYSCYREMDDRFLENQTKTVPKAKRVENVVENAFVPVSREEICRRLPDVSVSTVRRVLSQMVQEGRAVKIGTYRNARYKRK